MSESAGSAASRPPGAPPRVSPAAPARPNGGSVVLVDDGGDDAASELRAADRASLLLLFLASGGITGLALGGSILLAVSVFAAIVAGGIVGWFVHSFVVEGRTAREDSSCTRLPDERRT